MVNVFTLDASATGKDFFTSYLIGIKGAKNTRTILFLTPHTPDHKYRVVTLQSKSLWVNFSNAHKTGFPLRQENGTSYE